MEKHYKSYVIVSSDRAAHGTYKDEAGPAAEKWLKKNGYQNSGVKVIPDDEERIRMEVLITLNETDLLVVSGGTGLGPRDVTPQIVKSIAEYEIPGFGELLRQESLKYSLNSYLSRCGGYVKNNKLILALPGNPKAVTEQLNILKDLLPNALCALRGECKHRNRKVADSRERKRL
ncbi:MAG: MogA/MoaB family molybdenum cofactor biosynthesis protein [Deltaproteobacteria bacterium]|nr:MogA/MoaB family molybdenum cofactor biosynthesis protein [Deltaproteobacteria bacterium]MBI3016961.1 MogA/MoaB family molybdenum cofactor biosynthesis protein [Deltaproteobacteria bacterium]